MLEVSEESQGKSQFFNLFKLTIKDLEIKQETLVCGNACGFGGGEGWWKMLAEWVRKKNQYCH